MLRVVGRGYRDRSGAGGLNMLGLARAICCGAYNAASDDVWEKSPKITPAPNPKQAAATSIAPTDTVSYYMASIGGRGKQGPREKSCFCARQLVVGHTIGVVDPL